MNHIKTYSLGWEHGYRDAQNHLRDLIREGLELYCPDETYDKTPVGGYEYLDDGTLVIHTTISRLEFVDDGIETTMESE